MPAAVPVDVIHISDQTLRDERIACWLLAFEIYLKRLKRTDVHSSPYFKLAKKLCRRSRLVDLGFTSAILVDYEQAKRAGSLFLDAFDAIPLDTEQIIREFRQAIGDRGHRIRAAVEKFETNFDDPIRISSARALGI